MQSAWRHDIVVIGGSAGALDPLRRLLLLLPKGLPASVFVTLHIPPDYPSILPELLGASGVWSAHHPSEREPVQPGHVYVAPPDLHLVIEPGYVQLGQGPRENRHRPAIDVMFRSAARAYGPRVAAVLLSGQLDDGSAGLMAVKMNGGLTIVQDPAEAASPEMPSRAIQYAAPSFILPLQGIADLLISNANEQLPLRTAWEAAVVNEHDEIKVAKLESPPQEEPLGRPSAFACPDCHGVLWELEEGELLRFRCRVGHAYTANSLQAAFSEATEDALWAAKRVLEEKAALLRRLAERSGPRMTRQYLEDAAGLDEHALTIAKILLASQKRAREEKESDAA